MTGQAGQPAPDSRTPQSSTSRGSRGSQIIEVACSAVVLVVITIFCIDAGVVVLGYMFNDSACRDAARAASQASSATNALLVAKTAVAAHKGDGYFWTTPAITPADVVYNDYGGVITATNVPYVTVTTRSTIKMPAPILFLGARLNNDGTFESICHYTFPITNITMNIPGESP
jgi:hypothetical protein